MDLTDIDYVRTLNDVNSVIHHAKLSTSDLTSTSQVLYFSSDFPQYKLLECDSSILTYLENGGELFLRGRPSDKAVVCTNDRTYDLKGAETSNSLLLIPGLKAADDSSCSANGDDVDRCRVIEEKRIVGVYGEYYELKPIKPRLGRLRSLLYSKPYNGPENECDPSDEIQESKTFTLDGILQNVQGSQVEILANLEQLEAVEINGRWRVLEHEYHFRALSFLLNLVEENSWPPDSVPMGETAYTLKGLLPDGILDHVCHVYLQETDNYSDDGDQLFSLNEYKICRFLGESLLRPVDKFNLNDFLNAWSGSVPSGMETDLKQLDGIALHDANSNPPMIWFFPEYKLSEDLTERFAQLFAERRQWSLEQISPYVSSLTSDVQTVNALLTKYSRCSNVNGCKLYSARHGK